MPPVVDPAIIMAGVAIVASATSVVFSLRSTGHVLAAEQADLARSFEKTKAAVAEAVKDVERTEKRVLAHLEENEDLLERIETKRQRAQMTATRAKALQQQQEADPFTQAVDAARKNGWTV